MIIDNPPANLMPILEATRILAGDPNADVSALMDEVFEEDEIDPAQAWQAAWRLAFFASVAVASGYEPSDSIEVMASLIQR